MPHRILVIEDEFVIAMEIESTLARAGFEVEEAASTESEALARIQDGEWDGVVADANLNGREITRVAAALSQKRIPFVILTGYPPETLPDEVRQAPILEKPVRSQVLVRAVEALLANQDSSS